MVDEGKLDFVKLLFPSLTSRRTEQMKPAYKFCPYKVVQVQPSGMKVPKPRSGHRIVGDDKNIYCFGGYNPHTADVSDNGRDMDDFVLMHSCMLFKELWKYNIATRRWFELDTTGEMPEELASHSAVLLGHHLYVFGGTGVPFGASSSNCFHDCNLKSLRWSQPETFGEPPAPQYGQAMALDEGNLYVVGGTSGYEYSMEIRWLNLESKEWYKAEVTSHPEPRYRHEIATQDNKLYVFGGGTNGQCFGLKELPVFNLFGEEWESVTTSDNHPEARLCHGCVQIGEEVFICGGHNISRIFPDIWSLNLKTLNWRKLPFDLIEPVYFHSTSVTSEGEMFIFGGVNSMVENTRTNKMYRVWLKIPSLAEMCWQAVMHYIPNISTLRRSELYNSGIPTRFLDRVYFDSEVAKDSLKHKN